MFSGRMKPPLGGISSGNVSSVRVRTRILERGGPRVLLLLRIILLLRMRFPHAPTSHVRGVCIRREAAPAQVRAVRAAGGATPDPRRRHP